MAIKNNGTLFITNAEPIYFNHSNRLTDHFTVLSSVNIVTYEFNTTNNSVTIKSNSDGAQSSSTTYMQFTAKKDFVFSCTMTFNYPTNSSRRGSAQIYLNDSQIGYYDPTYHKNSTYHTANISIKLKKDDRFKISLNYSTATIVLSHMFANAPNPYYEPYALQGSNNTTLIYNTYYAENDNSCIKTNFAYSSDDGVNSKIAQAAKIISKPIQQYRSTTNYIYLMHSHNDIWWVSDYIRGGQQSQYTLICKYGTNSHFSISGSGDQYEWSSFNTSLKLITPIIGDYDFDYSLTERPILNVTASTGISSFDVIVKNTSGTQSSTYSTTGVTSYKKGIPDNYTFEIIPQCPEGYHAETITGTMTAPVKYTLTAEPITFPVNIIYSGNTQIGQLEVCENKDQIINLTKKNSTVSDKFRPTGVTQYEAGPHLSLRRLWGPNGSNTYQQLYSTDGVKGGNITNETYPAISYQLDIDLYKPRVIILFTTTSTNQYYNVVYGTNSTSGQSGWDTSQHCPYTQKMLAFNLPRGTTSFTLGSIKSYASSTSTSGSAIQIGKTYSITNGKATVIDLGAI